jgi:peptidoglycan hydrolase-like protein with peptidoglycan-binding domain
MILKLNSKSNSKQAVRAYRLLMGFPMEDDFSVALQTATKNFQREKGLKVDGIAGPQTFAVLVESLPDVLYKDYSGSEYVRAVQALVSCTVDGKYGSNTRKNVIAFQTTAGLEATGNVTKNDWLALWGCSYTRTAKPIETSGTNTVQPVDYKQADPRWGSKPYTITGSAKQTIASSGCGPTSMSDIMATWIDKAITPVEMCAYAIKHGFRTPSSGTAWGFFKSIANAYGFTGFVQTKSMATARAAIKNGAFVVASMGPGYWTKGGHFICLWKTDDTYMYANDPASKTRKKQKLAAFEEQRKQFFIFYKPGSAA